MVVHVKEFANAGSVRRRAPAHCGKSIPRDRSGSEKTRFFKKCGCAKKKNGKKQIEQLTSIGRKLCIDFVVYKQKARQGTSDHNAQLKTFGLN